MKLSIPLPLPDEVIYSTLARACRRLGISSYNLRQMLFDGREIIPRPHFCSQLDLVAGALRERAGWACTAATIKLHHTLAPLALPLLPAHIRPRCEAALHHAHYSRNLLGRCRQVLGIHTHTQLRFCPACRSEDRLRYGESYFHRVHQIPALQVCPHHRLWLRECEVTAEPKTFEALDSIVSFTDIFADASKHTQQMKLADEMWEILSHPGDHVAGLGALRTELTLGDRRQHFIPRSDTEWQDIAREALPLLRRHLQQSYRRAIRYATLRKALEQCCNTPMPPKFRTPNTVKLIKLYVESRQEWAERAAFIRCVDEIEKRERQSA
ncbi:MAG: TniQ family protein [Opitutaceae bacterium]|nr:TniQ family protein [Opitutaceae bacterium]